MIDITDLSLSYRPGAQTIEVLRAVNLHVRSGERLAIVGASGSGKSTLLSIIAGIRSWLKNRKAA